jgi:hypothetical protein
VSEPVPENTPDDTDDNMAPPSINIEEYKPLIEEMFRDRVSASQISQFLSREYNIPVSLRTLQRRLHAWGISQRSRTVLSSGIEERVRALFFDYQLNDQGITDRLRREGYSVTQHGVRAIRARMGLYRRLNDPADQEKARNSLRAEVRNELSHGIIQGYGRGLIHTHFRMRRINAGVFDILSVFKLLAAN